MKISQVFQSNSFVIFFLLSLFFGAPSAVNGEVNASVAGGVNHSLIMGPDGKLWAVGKNADGQLGDGTTQSRSIPVMIQSGLVQKIAAGSNYSLFIRQDGSLWGMGDNSDGQLGLTSDGQILTPTQIRGGVVMDIAAGDSHSLFVLSDGSLWAMGSNQFGQFGNGSLNDASSPVMVRSNGVTKVTAGSKHSLFIDENGSLWSMGSNEFGQLGDGTGVDSIVPVKIVESDVSFVSAGSSHSLFSKNDGSLWSIGYNGDGRLGDGSFQNRLSPFQVVGLNVTQVDAGSRHSAYLLNDGSLWTMGWNAEGQLGDGSFNTSNIPLQIETSVTSVANGNSHTLFVKDNEFFWAMGRNVDGQLGDATSDNRNQAVQMIMNEAPTDISQTTGLLIGENLPVGTKVTDFSGVDPNVGDSFTFQLVAGVGDSGNPLFTLLSDGELQSGSVFDFENAQSHSIRVRVIDQGGLSFEKVFEVTIQDANNFQLVLQVTGEGSVSGGGSYEGNSQVTITATANTGYMFSAWSGDVNSVEASLDVTMSDNLEINATFVPDRNDDDGDGLSNYTEIVLLDTNATNYDTDGDGFNDYDENQTVGLDPLVENSNLYSYVTDREQTARLAGKAEAQAELAEGGLSSLSYFQNVDLGQPYTSKWFYQPGVGWLWTSKESFPFIYRAADQESGVSAGWLYLSQTADQNKISLYDYGSETWLFQDF